MAETSIDSHFGGIWRRALNFSLENVKVSHVEAWARDRGLAVLSIEERAVGAFEPTKGIVLTVAEKKAFFPTVSIDSDPAWMIRHEAANIKAALWEKMEWFSPLWIPLGKVSSLLLDVKGCSKERAIELFNFHTSTIYTLAFQAVCIAQILPQSTSLKDFSVVAREAYLAFYSGYRASSIASLIPAIEGVLTRMISSDGAELSMPDKIDKLIEKSIGKAAHIHFENMWVPQDYLTTEYLFGLDERVYFFETFRRWLHGSFFKKTSEYDGVTWLNRHLFAHGISPSWQQSANFSRLVVVLASLGVVESWYKDLNQVSLFFPEMNEESTLLWQQAIFQAESQAVLKAIEAKRYHEHGRLVPEMPTDDGVLLRKAILSEDCINDLVRPLRSAGWNVTVGEPDEHALYMTVTATAGEEKFNATILYSCATANEIYRELSETSNVILYRGAPYHQDQYAYGVSVYVGPVAGWLPPVSPLRDK